MKNQKKILTDEDFYEIGKMHRELPKSEKNWNSLAILVGYPGSGEAYRCFVKKKLYRYENTNKTTDEQTNQDALKMKEYYIQRQRLRDERSEYNRLIRDDARIEALKDAIKEAVASLPKLRAVRPSYINHGQVEAVALFSDLHIGVDILDYCNSYNDEIAQLRVSKWVNKVIKFCHIHKVERLNVINLGDLIAGIIHITIRLQQQFDVITQVMRAGELLADALNRLQEAAPEIIYRSCTDNHSRIVADKTQAIEKENLGRLIDWYVEERLKNTAIVIKHDNLSPDLGKFTLKNGKVLHSNGGFFPLRRDRTAVSGSMQGMDSIMDMLDNTIGDIHNSSRVSMQTRQGQYMARTGANYVVDINYNSLLPSYFDDITSDIAFRDWAFQAARMIKNGQFQTAVISRWGDGVVEMFARNILDTLGFNKVENIDAMTALVDSTKRSVNAALVANPSTVLQGLTNVFMTPYIVEGWTVADAVRAYWKSFSEAGIPLSQKWRAYVKRAYNLSPLLEDMNANPDFDMYREYNSIDNNWFFRTRDGLANITMNAMNFIDNLTLIPQFYGIIEKAIREGKSEYEAIRLAEEGIRRIKPSDKKYQQSQFINAKPGSWQRYVNGLQSYGITMLNRTVDTFSLWQHRGFMESLPQIATYVTGTLIMSALATDIIGFRSPFSSDEKDKQTSEGFAKWAANSVLNNIANQIPVFGAIFSAGIARATDEPFYGVKTPSGISTLIEQGTRVTLKVGSEKASTADQVEAIARLTTMGAGVPQYFVNLLFHTLKMFYVQRYLIIKGKEL